jgi:peptidoglycan hydrolase-like protein with peptidoglycan-binding domain
MKLQGRNLEPNLRGDDVKLLQSELRKLKLKTLIVDPEGFFGSTTFLAVQEFQRLHGLEATGIVDQQTAQLINAEVDEIGTELFIVRGEVRRSDGDPMRGVIVRALRKGLRRDEPIGQATTAAAGDYNIEYRAAERPISIVVQASDTAGNVIAISDVICKARPLEIVNLTPDGVFRGPSEFKQLQDRLAPILSREGVRIDALEAEDVELLACAHGLNRERVTLLVASSRMAREAGVEAEAFYAIVRQGLPTVLIALVAQSPETLRRALETSVSENIVGERIGEQIPQILRDLQGQIVRLALEEPSPDRPTFRTLLEIAGVPQERQQTIVAAYVEREGAVTEFWQRLREQPGASDEEIESLQYAVGAAAIALNHPPLVGELTRMRRAGQLGGALRDLARFNRDDWESLIKGQSGGAPVGAPALLGEREEERESRYAEFLPRMVEAIFPTATLTHRLAEIDQATFAPTLAFLQQNPEFEFRTMRADEYLREHPDALNGVADRETAVIQLRAVQRMMNVATSFNKAKTVALIADGVDSAFNIRRMGATQFVRTRAEALGGVAAAEQVYTNAARQSDTALMLLSQSMLFNPTSPGIIAPHLFGEGIPDLEDLFGSLDMCQCEHCSSVYSPAAYLVDILHFLMNRPAKTPGRTALDVLFGDPADETRRRWDIGEIELTCHNTNTALPHVDLVNEILEQAVAPNNSFPFQTEGNADALGANPEHVNEQAYNILANAIYPWNLPFDLWAAETRRYLAQLGVRRDVLMERFRRDGAAPSPIDVAAEYLGLTPRERAIITGAATETTRQMWGMDVAEFNQLLSERRASVVLERSGLSYEELVELLDARFVDPGGAMRVEFAGADCNLATATVTGLTTGSLARMHRFVRLQRKLGWPVAELGDALAALGASVLNNDALTRLAALKRLREALKTPLETMLAWLQSRLDTQPRDRQPSLYDRIFNDPTVNPPELDAFRLNNTRTELSNPNLLIGDHAAAVSVALGVSADDLAMLLAEDLPSDRLNLANLTRLYKATTLAKASRIGIRDYVAIRAITGIDPFDAVASTESFVERARLVSESGFDTATLDYLLRHRAGAPAAMTDSQISDFLDKLRAGLQQIAADHEFVSDPTGARTAEKLALILPGDVVNRAVALLNNISTEDETGQIALINDHFTQFLDPAEAAERLVDPGDLTTPEERFDYVLERLLIRLSRVASEAFVVEGLAAALGLIPEVVNPLLRELVPSPNNADQPILTVFLATEESPEQIAAFHRLAKIAIMFNALEVPSEQVAFTITRGAELGWLDLNALPLAPQDSGASLFERWLAMVTLFRAAANLPDGVMTMFGIFGDLDNQQLTRGEFLDALAERTEWNRDDLEFLTGPDGFDLQFRAGFADGQFLVRIKKCFELLAPLGVAAEEAWRWAAPTTDAAIARAIKQAARAKFDDRGLWLAAAKPIRDDLRGEQRDALIAHLLHTARIIIPILETPQPTLSQGARRPAVRELQLKLNSAGANPPLKVDGIFGPLTRAAVIAFQEAHDLTTDGIVGPITWAALNQVRQRLRGPNDLYAHFLVDVEMAPCMLTSRIVLATNSVQLFAQRCLLNLEPEVELSPEDAKEWEWVKNYRVWEANRKVFLYPENWIEPELRDDKSPFFINLESGLLQDEVNDSTVEREYLKYLQDLDRVAQLEISGVYRQWEIDRDILHVIGRSRNTPHLYYYRRWVDQRYWTPWERVEADIDGDHLVPVVWNRRLYLFWPMFLEKADEEVISNEPPNRYYEIRIAWSEYRDGKWSPKRVTDDSLTTPSQRETAPPKQLFSFWSYFDDDASLVIASEMRDESDIRKLGQFFFSGCNDHSKVSAHKLFHSLKPFSGTFAHFNTMKEFPDTPGEIGVQPSPDRLYVVAGGHINNENGFIELVDANEPEVLGDTPGTFIIAYPQSERPFVCRSPFFYQDDKRTFFIAPRGKYVGGFTGPADDLTLELDTTPLELPDVVTLVASRSLAIGTGATTATQASPLVSLPAHWEATFFRFENFYHPYICLLIEQLNRHGIDGILRPDPEQEPSARKSLVKSLRRQQKSEAFFNATYKPNDGNVVNVNGLSASEKNQAGPLEKFDFSYGGAYSIYNWELFFHAPFMLAKRLSANQRFAESHSWFHYIFDPTFTTPEQAWPERVWQIKPFFDHGVGKSIEQAMLLLKSNGLSKAELDERKSLRDQIEAWRKTPFNPHLIARMRIEAYMKAVVMAYLDNLIVWGDHLFRQDTRESINEATQLYILAGEILGERPKEIPAHEGTQKTIDGQEVRTFNQLRDHLDAFSNALIDLETIVYPMETDTGGGGLSSVIGSTDFTLNTGNGDGPALDLSLAAPGVEPPDNGFVLDLPLATPIPAVLGPTLFFCIPKNDRLMGYWDTVADRLFKIRHCLNIEGVERQLALFAPPIDPGLLVKAAAAGLDIAAALSDLNAPSPHYRFQSLASKANEMINDVKNLGAALLAALEKKDAEELSLLRSTHEIQILEAAREIKQLQIDEAKASMEALETSKRVLEERRNYYESRVEKSLKEQQHLDKLEEAQKHQSRSNSIETARAAFGYLPDFDIGVEGAMSSPTVKGRWGSSNILSYMSAISQSFVMDASRATHESSKALTEAGYERRQEDWDFQATQAQAEIAQVEKQIIAAEIRLSVAEQDLKNHELQVENARAIDEFMRGKYTSQELYGWMTSQIAAVYFQSFQIASDLAKRAERAFRHELGVADTNFVQPGYWDSLKKGLLAGERLQYALRRMEAAYLDLNRREYEITKHISLATLDPLALLMLRETGECFADMPETLFDMDYPGHYLRRIKTVGLTIPCVVGPYTGVNCTLTLLANSMRRVATPSSPYPRNAEGDDPRFADNIGAIQSIVTSDAQGDSGMFELNFRDERYLPFEGAGAISRWRIELPIETNRFDRGSISDVVIHLRYTAREGGAGLRTEALESLPADGARMFSLRHEFPTEWHRFLHPVTGAEGQPLRLNRMNERFPFRRPGATIRINRVDLLGRFASIEQYTATLSPLVAVEMALNRTQALGGLHHASQEGLDVDLKDAPDWELRLQRGTNDLESDEVENIFIICSYMVAF